MSAASFFGTLRAATDRESADIKARANGSATAGAVDAAAAGVSPGVERWAVKTGTDPDVANVRTVIVDTTVAELGNFPRPAALLPPTVQPTGYERSRFDPVETTVWRVAANVIAFKRESDGDYHLVLQDATGSTMIAEVPLPTAEFIDSSIYFSDIAAARSAVDQQFAKTVAAQTFAAGVTGKLVPIDSLPKQAAAAAKAVTSIDLNDVFSDPKSAPAFSMQIAATPVTISGVGFFDRDHGQTGRAPNIVELHPVLAVAFSA